LFEGGIRFSRRARGEEILVPLEEFRQIPVDIKVQPLERPELIKERAADYEDHFVFHERAMFEAPKSLVEGLPGEISQVWVCPSREGGLELPCAGR
jgi:hypothetical protein